jgi:hypothetical protein
LERQESIVKMINDTIRQVSQDLVEKSKDKAEVREKAGML